MSQFNFQAVNEGDAPVQMGRVNMQSQALNIQGELKSDAEVLSGLLGQGVQAAAAIYQQHDQNEQAFADKQVRDINDELSDLRSQRDENGNPIYTEQELYGHLKAKGFEPNRRNKRAYQALEQKQAGLSGNEYDRELSEEMRTSWNALLRGNNTQADRERWLDEWKNKIVDRPGSATKTAWLAYESTVAGGIATEAKANSRIEASTAAEQWASTYTVDETTAQQDGMNMLPANMTSLEEIQEFMVAQYAANSGKDLAEVTMDERRMLEGYGKRLFNQRLNGLRDDDIETQETRVNDLREKQYDADHVNDVATTAAGQGSSAGASDRVGKTLDAAVQGTIAGAQGEEQNVAGDVIDLFTPESEGGTLDDSLLVAMGFKDENGDWTDDGETRFANWQDKHVTRALDRLEQREAARLKAHMDEVVLSPDQDHSTYLDEEGTLLSDQARSFGLPDGAELVREGSRLVLKVGDEIITSNEEIQKYLANELGVDEGQYIYRAKLQADALAGAQAAREVRVDDDRASYERAISGDATDDADYNRGVRESSGYKYLNGSYGGVDERIERIRREAKARGQDLSVQEASDIIANDSAKADEMLRAGAERDVLENAGVDIPDNPEERRRLATAYAMADLEMMIEAQAGRGLKMPQAVKDMIERGLSVASSEDGDPRVLADLIGLYGNIGDMTVRKQMLEGLSDFQRWQFEEFHRLASNRDIQDTSALTELWAKLNVNENLWEGNNEQAMEIVDAVVSNDPDKLEELNETQEDLLDDYSDWVEENFPGMEGADADDTLRKLIAEVPEMRLAFLRAYMIKAQNPDVDAEALISMSFAKSGINLGTVEVYDEDGNAKKVWAVDTQGHTQFSENELYDLGVKTQGEAIEKMATTRAQRVRSDDSFADGMADSFSMDTEDRRTVKMATNSSNFADDERYGIFLTNLGYKPAEVKAIVDRGYMTQAETIRLSVATAYKDENGQIEVYRVPPVGPDGLRLVPADDSRRRSNDMAEPTRFNEDGTVKSSGGLSFGILLPPNVVEEMRSGGAEVSAIITPRANGVTPMLRYSRNIDAKGNEENFSGPKAERKRRRELRKGFPELRNLDSKDGPSMKQSVDEMEMEELVVLRRALDAAMRLRRRDQAWEERFGAVVGEIESRTLRTASERVDMAKFKGPDGQVDRAAYEAAVQEELVTVQREFKERYNWMYNTSGPEGLGVTRRIMK